jgi:hypothetical protein
MTSYQDFLVSSYFWILIGILYRLPSLALLAQFNATTVPLPSQARVVHNMKPQSIHPVVCLSR